MHELSVATHLLQLCLENAAKNSAKKISKIFVKIGKLSGVEPHFLESAFDVIKSGSIAEDAEMNIHHQEIIAYCSSCDKEYQIDDYYLACPECKSIDVKIIDGEELLLMSLELDG